MGFVVPLRLTRWHGFPGYQLFNEDWNVVAVPHLGGRVAVIGPAGSRQNWLAEPVRPPQVGTRRWADGDCSGWDELFPNISEEVGRHGVLPEHGTLWSRPWTARAEGAALVTEVRDDERRVSLRRALTLTGDRLTVDYLLHHRGADVFEACWAAHPLLPLDPETRLVFPEGCELMPDPAGVAEVTGEARYADPVRAGVVTPAGQVAVPSGECLKLYAKVGSAPWVMVDGPDGTITYRLGARRDMTFGLWMNNRGWSKEHPMMHLAVEPCIGLSDDRALSKELGSCLSLESGGVESWSFDIDLCAKRR